MFQDNPFKGACSYATYEVLMMLIGSVILGLVLGYLIWGWLRKHVSVLKKRNATLQHMADLRQLNVVNVRTRLAFLNDQVELLEAKLSLSEYRLRKALDEAEALKNPAQEQHKISPSAPSDAAHQKELFTQTPSDKEEPTTLADISQAMETGTLHPSGPAPKNVPLHSVDPGKDESGDDLQVIVGIDEKMEDILHRLGIRSWSNLAYIRPEDLQRIIEDAGPDYAALDPRSWIMQARMASKGEWKKLKAYQETLS